MATKIPIYRFKFSSEIVNMLKEFSQNNKDKTRNEFNKEWKLWTESNKKIIVEEIIRIQDLGYDGDIIKKMYNSCRYYYSKKETLVGNKEKTRRVYVKFDKHILASIDKHILDNIEHDDYKPSIGYNEYYEKFNDEIIETVNKLTKETNLSNDEVLMKYKKTYKNRYYIISKKM